MTKKIAKLISFMMIISLLLAILPTDVYAAELKKIVDFTYDTIYYLGTGNNVLNDVNFHYKYNLIDKSV